MIDALEVRIPEGFPFRPRWRGISNEADGRNPRSLNLTNSYFRIDLRGHGLHAAIHSSANGIRGYKKLSFINTCNLSYAQMTQTLEDLFTDDVSSLKVLRIDFAVDIDDVPVDWFHRHSFVPKKRFSEKFGVYSGSGSVVIETLYMGKRPNCFRIYSRFAKVNDDPQKPYCCLTRVERQCGGSGIPRNLRTFGEFGRNATDAEPFSALRAFFAARDGSSIPRQTIMHLLARRGLQVVIEERGSQETARFLNMHSRGNAARILRRLQVSQNKLSDNFPQAFEKFRESVRSQLGSSRREIETRPTYENPEC